MRQIKKFSFTRLLDGAFAEFHSAFIVIITAFGFTKLSIEKLFADYQKASEKLNKSINRSRKSPNTQELAKADGIRDRVINRLFKLVKDFWKSPILEENAAGTTLWNIISSFEGLTTYEMNKQTALTKVMLMDLNKPAAIAAIGVLNLGSLIEQIELYNSEVEALMADRVEKESKIEKVNIPELRREITSMYEEIVLHINAVAVLIPDKDVEELIVKVNTHIEQYERVTTYMRAGGSGNEKRTKKEDDENPEIITGED